MFDWNDEELANIIWGEGGESDDHIVPYPEVNEDLSNKKEWNQEAVETKLTELKRPEAKTDFHERKLGSSSNLDNSGELPGSGYGTNSWPDLSLSSAAKIDQGSLGTEVPRNLSEPGQFSSPKGGKEQGDFVDYGWANIGSFDDFDRIFSNDDSIFGHVSLDNSNELWSSKDVSNNPAALRLDTSSSLGALRNRTEPSEVKEEYVQCNGESLDLSYEKIGGSASQVIQNSCTIAANVGSNGVRSKPTRKEQQVFRENLLKTRKKSRVKQEGNAMQDFYGNWSPSTAPAKQFESQLASSVILSSPSSILGQPKQIQGAETLYQNIINPYVASSVYGNLSNTYPAMPMLSQIQSGDLRHQPALSGYEVSPGIVNSVKNSVDSVNPQTMTPQEKIEKLRRRQQMQAMLAIQKQRQQLSHQIPSTSKSSTQKCPPEIQSHLSDGTDEDLITLPALDPPIEQDDSNTMSMVAADNDFVEDTILYRFQDIISKLDIKIRLCIRDSLFRLAQSAMQRHYASDTSSTNKNSREELEVAAREESNSQNRSARMPDYVETETNPIDRTVAHLLFHGPKELIRNYSDKLESPISTKVQCESKAANLVNFPVSCLPEEDLKNNHQLSHLGFKNSWFEAQSMDQIKNNTCLDTSENASNTQELEGSQ